MAKILLVEDDMPTVELMELVLKPRGYEIIHTNDGSKAFKMAKEHRPELIILDMMLPQMDGYGVQMQMLEDDDTKKIPILITTSKAMMEEVFKTADNVRGFISKPFTVRELVDKIRNILNKSA